MTLIGLSEEEAVKIVKDKGYAVKILENISPKQKLWDTRLVVGEKYDEERKECVITVSNFLLSVKSEE